MNVITRPTVAALLLLITLTGTTAAQQKRQTPAKPQPKATAPAPAPTPAPTFDTLVPAESYTLYGEVRSVGQLIQANAANEILEPILKLAGPPKEFQSLVKWLNTHAEELMSSRLLVAMWPIGGKDVPETLIAIEFASAEDAAKFAAKLNQMLPTVVPPVPGPTPEAQAENPKATPPTEPGVRLQQAGSLILLTRRPLNLKKLKPAGGKLLAEDSSFRAARNRFNSEPLFVFIDVKLMERQEEERRKQSEEAQRRRQEVEQNLKQHDAAVAELKKSEELQPPPPAEEEKEQVRSEQRTVLVGTTTAEENGSITAFAFPGALSTVASLFFGAEAVWPDAIGVALSFEGDSFDLRALLVNSPGEKSDTIPFVPMLIPGPPLVSEAPNILPADTELFATMSLDWPQIHAAMSKPRPTPTYNTSRGNVQPVNEGPFEPPFAAIEKQLKINLKDELLPLLGSEIALRLPVTGLDVIGVPRGPAPAPNTKENTTPQRSATKTAPVVLISLKDKEGMRALMPKVVEALGFKGANAFANTERREDTELVSYVNMFAYAFIGNFLVLSSDPGATRHVVDSYLKHETLSSDSNFRSYTRWQPRPAYGQLYISPALMESYKSWIEESMRFNDQTRPFLLRLVSMAQPVTYSLSNEGFGPLHELHVPRNLILMAVAGISTQTNPTPVQHNEQGAMGRLYMIAYLQDQYKQNKGAGSYGTLEQLIAAGLVAKEMLESGGYKIELVVTGDGFEVFATPVEYGKSGTMSYFIDQTRVLRGADRAGASANSSDPPIR